MANVQTSKCDRNLQFIFNKIAKLEVTIEALANHLGLEMKIRDKDKTDGKTNS